MTQFAFDSPSPTITSLKTSTRKWFVYDPHFFLSALANGFLAKYLNLCTLHCLCSTVSSDLQEPLSAASCDLVLR